MSTVAVIPVKNLANAKQRLSGLLSASSRQMLFTAMFQDVLEAVSTCDAIDRVLVVTDDEQVRDIALAFGAEVRSEPATPGLIPAVTESGRQLAAEGVTSMLFLPADVPLITVEELEIVLGGFGRRDGPECLIVPATDLGGSNCVVCSPPDCMPFGFGEDSFRRHLGLARQAGIEPAVAKLPGIGLDVDVPEDLSELARRILADGLCTNTARFLESEGIMAKQRAAS